MKLNSLEEVFLSELKDVYDAEKQITRALPKMIKAASSEELADALREHLDVTREQITRLDRVFKKMGESPGRSRCEAMQGLLEEGSELIEKDGEPSAKDAAMICGAQKVEHYEMATYGSLRTWAQMLGKNDLADILQEILDEEGEADKKLTSIAESLNLQAIEENA